MSVHKRGCVLACVLAATHALATQPDATAATLDSSWSALSASADLKAHGRALRQTAGAGTTAAAGASTSKAAEANLYSILTAKPYYSEFKELVDLLGLSSTAVYPFAPTTGNPFFRGAPATAARTAFIPNNHAMAQAYSALLVREGKPPICANAAAPTAVSCGWKLPATAANWLAARPDLRAAVLNNQLYMRLVVASHVLREAKAFSLSTLAPKLDEMQKGIVLKATDADRITQARSVLYFYAGRWARLHICKLRAACTHSSHPCRSSSLQAPREWGVGGRDGRHTHTDGSQVRICCAACQGFGQSSSPSEGSWQAGKHAHVAPCERLHAACAMRWLRASTLAACSTSTPTPPRVPTIGLSRRSSHQC